MDTLRFHQFPRRPREMLPTSLGNVLAAAENHTAERYNLDAVKWSPRLAPLLPETFHDQLNAAWTPMVAWVNFSAIFGLLAFVGGIFIAFSAAPWWVCIAFLVGGLLLSRVSYLIATQGALEYGEVFRTAFDLHRFDILEQMRIPLPADLQEERALWPKLGDFIYYGTIDPSDFESTLKYDTGHRLRPKNAHGPCKPLSADPAIDLRGYLRSVDSHSRGHSRNCTYLL
jgi:hypothetical protein